MTMAAAFNIEIWRLAKTALAELAIAKQQGKVPNNPASEAHFFSAWVTRAIKQQRFPHCLAKLLLSWQKSARTQGIHAGLAANFTAIIETYEPLVVEDECMAPVTQLQLLGLCEALQQQQWLVERDYSIQRKVRHHTDGQHSLVINAEQWQNSFAPDGTLMHPLSLYVRGDVRQLTDVAMQHQLLLHKVTDYKSLVKYHGEYLIYPANAGNMLAQLVS